MRFSKRQFYAMKMSVKKWGGILFEGNVDSADSDCKCCQFYLNNGCKTCPISIFTGFLNCIDTPYHEWRHHQRHAHNKTYSLKIIPDCQQCPALATKEHEFLKGCMVKMLKINLENL